VGRKFLAPYAEAASNIVEQVGTIEELRQSHTESYLDTAFLSLGSDHNIKLLILLKRIPAVPSAGDTVYATRLP
jgi:hypothetical protein